jgi:hypothetical protein
MQTKLITVEEAIARAPALAATSPSPRVSERYEFVNSAEVLRALGELGFGVRSTTVVLPKKRTDTALHKRHVVALRRFDSKSLVKKDDVAPELIFLNSHDGSSAVHLFPGLLRMACSNGMIVAERQGEGFRFRHSQAGLMDRVAAAADAVGTKLTQLGYTIEKAQGKQLTQQQQLAFARRMSGIRWVGEEGPTLESMLQVQRDEDRPEDAWTIFNRLQERVIRGSLPVTVQGRTGMRTIQARTINDPIRTIDLNTSMWRVLEETIG